MVVLIVIGLRITGSVMHAMIQYYNKKGGDPDSRLESQRINDQSNQMRE
jgi:hypothetical protein